MADWSTRLRETITLETPNGTEYVAKWRGNPIEITNKTGIHEFPGIAGAKVQDLGVGAFVYALTIHFDGVDNDLDATDFMNDFRDQVGDWKIVHPVKGPKFVTKISARELADPTGSGNVTTIETSWIEGLPDSEEETAAQIQAQAEYQSQQLNATANEQFVQNAKQDTPGQRQSIVSQIGKATTAIQKNLAVIENISLLDPEITAIAASIQNLLSEDAIDTSSLAGQIQQYVQLYTLGQPDAATGIAAQENFIGAILDLVPDTATDENLSAIAVTELTACAGLTAVAQCALIGGIESRSEAVTLSTKISDIFQEITQALDEVQTLYSGQPIDKAYFSQTDTFADAMLAATESIKFLLTSVYALPAERIVYLLEDKATVQIAKDEYGSINNGDDEFGNYDKLVQSNDWVSDYLYWVPAGTEVLIYQSN